MKKIKFILLILFLSLCHNNSYACDLLGIGTIAMTPSGIFVKTEGTYTEFGFYQENKGNPY